MTTAVHTPGPWRLTYGGNVEAVSGEYIVAFHWDSFKEFDELSEKSKANCRLIAAAPELLAALQALIPMFAEWHSDFPEHVGDNEKPALQLARAAIAKATGAA